MKILFLLKIVLLITLLFSNSHVLARPHAGIVEWTMINVNYSPLQGDAHFIQTDTNKNVLIDAGYLEQAKNSLIPFLLKKNIKKIDTVFISHPHKDHYAGLTAILDSGIKIDEIYFNIPDQSLCDPEIPWGCDYSDILKYHLILKNNGTKIKPAKAGMLFQIGTVATLKILYAFNGLDTPVGRTDINDLSLIMLLKNGSQTALFTGDLNHKMGEYLAKEAEVLKADILKFPHHATEGAPPNTFYDAVSPIVAMVPSPALLWCSLRSERMRQWLEQRQIPSYINGFSGNVVVTMHRDSFKIKQERPKTRLPLPICPKS